MSDMFAFADSFNQPLEHLGRLLGYRHDPACSPAPPPFNQNLGPWYITLIDLDISNDERTIGNIAAQNRMLASHNPAYNVTGAHADLFEVVDGTILRLKPGQILTPGTTYQVNVTATWPYPFYGSSSYHHVIRVTAAEHSDPFFGAPDHVPDHAFVTTWTTVAADQAIRFPVSGSGITIDWGDGNTTGGVSGPLNPHLRAARHLYTVIVTGNLERFHLRQRPRRGPACPL